MLRITWRIQRILSQTCLVSPRRRLACSIRTGRLISVLVQGKMLMPRWLWLLQQQEEEEEEA